MKFFLILSFVLLLSTAASAQTKRIAMRSHSGTGNNVGAIKDNWGLPPEFTRERRRIEDSIRKAWEYRKRQDSILNEKIQRDSLRKASATSKKSKKKKGRLLPE